MDKITQGLRELPSTDELSGAKRERLRKPTAWWPARREKGIRKELVSNRPIRKGRISTGRGVETAIEEKRDTEGR